MNYTVSATKIKCPNCGKFLKHKQGGYSLKDTSIKDSALLIGLITCRYCGGNFRIDMSISIELFPTETK